MHLKITNVKDSEKTAQVPHPLVFIVLQRRTVSYYCFLGKAEKTLEKQRKIAVYRLRDCKEKFILQLNLVGSSGPLVKHFQTFFYYCFHETGFC